MTRKLHTILQNEMAFDGGPSLLSQGTRGFKFVIDDLTLPESVN